MTGLPPPSSPPEYEVNGVRYALTPGNRSFHDRAIDVLWVKVREDHPTAKREERFLSGYEESNEVTVEYPVYGKLVLDYIAARHDDLVYVWDLWPADEELWEEYDVLDRLDPRQPDPATRHEAQPAPGPNVRPMTLYFPRNPSGLGGYRMSIFNAENGDAFLPPDVGRPVPVPGFVYYQTYRELSEPPYLVDALEPAAVEVSGPGIHPDPTASTEQSLFPSPIKVSGPGVLPTPEQLEASRRVIMPESGTGD